MALSLRPLICSGNILSRPNRSAASHHVRDVCLCPWMLSHPVCIARGTCDPWPFCFVQLPPEPRFRRLSNDTRIVGFGLADVEEVGSECWGGGVSDLWDVDALIGRDRGHVSTWFFLLLEATPQAFPSSPHTPRSLLAMSLHRRLRCSPPFRIV